MVRIIKENEPISFICDEQVACEGVDIATDSFYFMDAYQIMQQHGWKAFRASDGVWTHSCPHCYVEWCRRAKVEPYETSAETTYDEIRAAHQHTAETLGLPAGTEVPFDPDALEPKWFLAARAEEKKNRKRTLAKKKMRRNRGARARSEIPLYSQSVLRHGFFAVDDEY